ncbi:MAG: hypothetical protein MR209_04755 [Veillonellaceae bacterium]|nr:hypothetical protein [Veillonellaceae bacterium]
MRIPMMTAAFALTAMLVQAVPAPLTGWGVMDLPKDTTRLTADMPLATVGPAEITAARYWQHFGLRGGKHYLLRHQNGAHFSYAQLSILPPQPQAVTVLPQSPSLKDRLANKRGTAEKKRGSAEKKRGSAEEKRATQARLQEAVAYWDSQILPQIAGNVRLTPYGKEMYSATWVKLGVREGVAFPRSYRVLVAADGAVVLQGDEQSAAWLDAMLQAVAAGKGKY